MWRWIGSLACALALASAANADVYKCTSEAGETVFSDIACPADHDRQTVRIDRPASDLGEYREVRRHRPPSLPAPPPPLTAGSWSIHGGDWDVARHYSVQRCRDRHPDDYALQAGCVRNAERGFRDMKGDFGLPPQVAARAKAMCVRRHPGDFAIQAGCMRNQADGYAQMR